MGDRHGGRFARRGRALNPPRPQVDAHRGADFRWRATVFRCRGVVGRICPAQEYAPRRRPPDTAHGRKDLPRSGTRPSAKASRHGARAKGFAPRKKALLNKSLPTRRTSEKICPAREHAPRRRPPDTAHERRDLPAQEHAPRRKPPDTAHEQKNLPTRERSPRRRHPDTAHERKDLPRAGTRPTAKASRHGAKAKGFAPQEHAPRRRPSDTAHERKDLPRGVRVRPTCRRTAGRPRSTDSQKNTPSAGSHPQRVRPLPSSFT